jgi:hypothetical protein
MYTGFRHYQRKEPHELKKFVISIEAKKRCDILRNIEIKREQRALEELNLEYHP